MRYSVRMRTTLDIKPRVLAAARARVHSGLNTSIGEAVSDLALAGLGAEAPVSASVSGLLLLPSVAGHVVTDEMVTEALEDD